MRATIDSRNIVSSVCRPLTASKMDLDIDPWVYMLGVGYKF